LATGCGILLHKGFIAFVGLIQINSRSIFGAEKKTGEMKSVKSVKPDWCLAAGSIAARAHLCINPDPCSGGVSRPHSV